MNLVNVIEAKADLGNVFPIIRKRFKRLPRLIQRFVNFLSPIPGQRSHGHSP